MKRKRIKISKRSSGAGDLADLIDLVKILEERPHAEITTDGYRIAVMQLLGLRLKLKLQSLLSENTGS